MAFLNIREIDTLIIDYFGIDLRNLLVLACVDKKSNKFIVSLKIYQEFIRLKNSYVKIRNINFNNQNILGCCINKNLFYLFGRIYHLDPTIILTNLAQLLINVETLSTLKKIKKIIPSIIEMYGGVIFNNAVCFERLDILNYLYRKNYDFDISNLCLQNKQFIVLQIINMDLVDIFIKIVKHDVTVLHIINVLHNVSRDSLKIKISNWIFENEPAYFFEQAPFMVKNAICNKNIAILEYLKSKNYNFQVPLYIMNKLGYTGDIELAKWFLYNGCFRYTHDIINFASMRGHVHFLDWFKTIGLEFMYTNIAMDSAAENGHDRILEWFKNSGLELKYTTNSVYYAAKKGHYDVLNWFKNSGLEFKYCERVIDYASENGIMKLLTWFENSGYKIKYTVKAINLASKNGFVQVLEWFKKNNLSLLSTNIAIKLAFFNGHLGVLNWYVQNKYKINLSKKTITIAKITNDHARMNWLKMYALRHKNTQILNVLSKTESECPKLFRNYDFGL